jgi:hemoglobin
MIAPKDAAMAILVVLALIVIVCLAREGLGLSPVPASKTLYDRLGGAFSIAAVVDHFSDAVLKSPIVGVGSPNIQLREWSSQQSAARLPGLKFLRTLWVCDVAGGPFRYHGTEPGKTHLDLSRAHRNLRISSAEFDEVARLLAVSLAHFNVPGAEKEQVLGAFLAHKVEVVAA